MRIPLHFYKLLLFAAFAVSACEDEFKDELPKNFYNIQLRPDDIYLYNSGSTLGVRLDPLINDSIKVDATITYSTPSSGTISFIANEGWFYRPNDGFIGTDKITYTVCYDQECFSALIRMIVEAPYDPDNCTVSINSESAETSKDTPVEIRIFGNDHACPYQGSSVWAPEKGTFRSYSYSGSFKNVVYVYSPPKGFTGTDQFKYRIFTHDGFVEAQCTITIK